MDTRAEPAQRLRVGVPGLDEVLRGGLERNRLYLIEGTPGTGKTTLALRFLLAGQEAGLHGLYITLSESIEELRAVANGHGWSLDGIEVVDLVAEQDLDPEAEQTILHPSELELGETTRGVMARVDASRSALVVFDSLSEMRLLAQNPLRYRRQVLALKHYFGQRGCTVLMLDDRTSTATDLQLHSIAHGVITLEQMAMEFGSERRRLRVMKMRGAQYQGGYHDFTIEPGGLIVYPRLVARDHVVTWPEGRQSSGNAGLDALLGGGLTPGTSLLLSGPAGIGKSTIATSAVVAALQRGQKGAFYLFDEGQATLMARSAALGLDIASYAGTGQLVVRQIDPAEISPGAFASLIRHAVETDGVSVVVIDSLNGYLQSMPGEQNLLLQMHELLAYLSQRGTTAIMVLSQHGVVGELRSSVNLSYLADSIMLLRYFEVDGAVRKAISVIKTRTTEHERTIREFSLGTAGLRIGEPLRGFSGVLSGAPVWTGEDSDLFGRPDSGAADGRRIAPPMNPLLVLAPHGRDASVICQVLESAGIAAASCRDLQAVNDRLAATNGVVLTEEALAGDAVPALLDWVARQPPWSDLPFIMLVAKQVMARTGRRAAVIEALGNAVLLERPLNADSLSSAARSAIRARRRQLAMRDLTDTLELRVAQRTRALAETEAQFRAVFEGFPESLFVVRVEPDGSFVHERRNPAAARRTGLPDAEVRGQASRAFMPEEQAELIDQAFRRCVQTGETVELSGEMHFPAGSAIYDVTLTPMPDADGRVVRILGVARDVSERVRLEKRLRQAQKLEAVGQLTGGVAHDFNNLLQVVLSGLTLMERVQDPVRREKLAESVRRAAQRGGDLTKRLLTVARRQALRPQAIDIAAWLQDGAAELLDRALRGDIVTERRVALGLPAIEVDPGELELAVLNLAVNARDAMEDGGRLTIGADLAELSGEGEDDGLAGRFVRLSVQDTGTGMSAETMARVFEPFFTTKEIGKGTGLGLAQVYGFAKQSGGGVRLDSAPGRGTTVSLLLPVARRAVAAPALPVPQAPAARPGLSVLVVEDNDDVAALVVDMLRQLGHHPTLVSNAAGALGALADERPVDLLFTDVLMPGGMDGLALAREAGRRRPGLRVLLTTGYSGGGPATAPLGVPMLRKPYRLDELAGAVSGALAPAVRA